VDGSGCDGVMRSLHHPPPLVCRARLSCSGAEVIRVRTFRRNAGSSHGLGPRITTLRVASALSLLTRPNIIRFRVTESKDTRTSGLWPGGSTETLPF
jgi:hypothetical protein